MTRLQSLVLGQPVSQTPEGANAGKVMLAVWTLSFGVPEASVIVAS